MGLVDHRGQAVGAEQEDVAVARRGRVGVDLDVRLGAERARDDRALRVLLGLLGELALAHELLDQRVVVGEPLEARRRATGRRGCRRRARR